MLHRDSIVSGLLLVFGFLLILPFALSGAHFRTPDGLHYEAQKLEVEGESAQRARHQVATSSLASEVSAHSPKWDEHLEFRAQFYRRRWTVPVLAAAITPIFGTDSLKIVSLFAWMLLSPLLFLLLRRRFEVGPSAAAAAAAMFLPPVLMWGPEPLTDMPGLTMLTGGLLVAFLARKDLRWLPAWILVAFVATWTRDLVLPFVLGMGWLAYRERSRKTALVAAAGFVASLPPYLMVSAPLRASLTFKFSHHQIIGEQSWGWVLRHAPGYMANYVVKHNLTYPLHVAFPYSALAVFMAAPVFAGLVFLARDRSPFSTMMRAAAVGSAITILLAAIYTELRLELLFVPMIAAGFALLAEKLWERRQEVDPSVVGPTPESASA